MFRRIVVYICSLLLFVFPAGAEGLSRERKAVKVSGDVLLAAMPVATVATVLAMKDWTGAKQGLFTGVTTLGVSYLLKFTVKKDRPDHSNRYSFPSAHTSLLFANAAFVTQIWLEMGCSRLCVSFVCGLESCVWTEARLVGCGGGSCYRSRLCIYLYSSVRSKP